MIIVDALVLLHLVACRMEFMR